MAVVSVLVITTRCCDMCIFLLEVFSRMNLPLDLDVKKRWVIHCSKPKSIGLPVAWPSTLKSRVGAPDGAPW